MASTPLAAVRDITAALLGGSDAAAVLAMIVSNARDLAHADLAWLSPAGEDVGASFADAMTVPIGGPRGGRGFLCVANDVGGDVFGEIDHEIVETFALQASLVLEHHAQRTLHDTVMQRLFAAGMTLQSARTPALPEKADAQVARALDDLDETIREIRTTVFSDP
jgi:hypothetical protein